MKPTRTFLRKQLSCKRRTWFPVLVAATVLVATTAAPPALATTITAAHVVPGPVTDLRAVACSAAITCLAVGSDSSGQAVVVPVDAGTPSAGQEISGVTLLSGIACPSATTCVAVGENAENHGRGQHQAAVVPITNGVPGVVSLVGTVPPSTSLHAVACPTATTCLAVGYDSVSPGLVQGRGILVPIINGVPGAVEEVPGVVSLDGVACSSATSCLAVGSNPSGQPVMVLITNGTPGVPVVSGAGAYVLSGVACPNATTCVAVGYNVVVPITNGTPGAAVTVPGATYLFGVGCAGGTTCVAAGSNSSYQAVVVTISESSPRPTDANACKNGGWKSFSPPFKNQGECVNSVKPAQPKGRAQ